MSFPFGILDRLTRRLRRRSGVEAGAGGHRWDGASVLSAPQQQTLARRGVIQARSAAAYVNTPYGQRIVEAWTAALVGKGWQARSRHPDAQIRTTLNNEFEALAGPHLTMLARALVRDGEAFLRIVTDESGDVDLRPIPAEQVDPSLTRDLGGGARIVSGIEFDEADRVVAYHVLREAPGTPFAVYGDAVRVPAVDMLHIFDAQFPGQIRGISWLSPVLTKLRDRDETSDAMLMREKTAALMTGFIRDAQGGFGGFEGDVSGSSMNVALEPGAMRILPGGTDIVFSQPGQGLAQAVDFLRSQDREIAAGVGMTFEALTGDLGEANYSSARVGLLEFRRRAEMLQSNLIEGFFLRPLWLRWIDIQTLSGRIASEAGDMRDYRAVRFVAPGWQWVDPQNEVQAEVAAIEAGLKSREEVIAGRGRDIDELNEEIARDNIRQSERESA